MFTKLLVPLDGTPQAAAALPLARAYAEATKADIVLLRAVPGRPGPAPDTDVQQARQYLAGVAHELAGAGPRVETVVATREPARAILEETRGRDVDLIVMTTHGRTGLGRAVLGSVAERVLERSPVPVSLLRPGGHRVTHIQTLLVPVDGTPGGAIALGAAVGLARASGAKIVLYEVVVPVPAYVYNSLPGVTLGGFIDPQWDEEARESAQSYVDGLVERLRKVGLQAEGYARIGTVAETIVAAAEERNADAIVMSTHALTGPARTVLGSVADEVVRQARRPVLLIRREVPPPHEETTPVEAAQEKLIVAHT